MTETVILKIGGSVLTKKDQPFTVNQGNLERIAGEIASAYDPDGMRLVLIHGAGSFGHYIAKRTGIHEGMKTQGQAVAFAETQKWQNYWNSMVVTELNKLGLPAIPVQASAFAVMEDRKIAWMPTRAVQELLDKGMIPVLYGVPAVDMVHGCSILSGDQILSWLAREIRPDRIIHGIDVDGIFTDDPRQNPEAELLKDIDMNEWETIKGHLSGSSSVDVTGGMLGKVQELLDLTGNGMTCEMVNAMKEGFVERALSGESGLGTTIR